MLKAGIAPLLLLGRNRVLTNVGSLTARLAVFAYVAHRNSTPHQCTLHETLPKQQPPKKSVQPGVSHRDTEPCLFSPGQTEKKKPPHTSCFCFCCCWQLAPANNTAMHQHQLYRVLQTPHMHMQQIGFTMHDSHPPITRGQSPKPLPMHSKRTPNALRTH